MKKKCITANEMWELIKQSSPEAKATIEDAEKVCKLYKNVENLLIEREKENVRKECEQEIADLKVQLEIANGTRNRLTFVDRLEIYENARKKTAKEILQILKDNLHSGKAYPDWLLVWRIENRKINDLIGEISAKFDIEVDE